MRERKVAAVWDRMDALHAERGLVAEDEGFTVIEYAERYTMSRDGAYGRLQKLVRDGKLVGGWARRAGKRTRVFRFPEA